MSATAFFSREDDHYAPLLPSRGYWKHDSLHGRAIIGLLGYELDRLHNTEGFVPVRLNVDMFRLAEFDDVRIETRVLKASRRLRLASAVMFVRGEAAAYATCQFLKPTEAPPGHVWSPAHWQASNPDALASVPEGPTVRLFEMREITGSRGGPAPKQIWVRERHALIEGVPLTPYARIVLAADFASPFAHAGDAGIRYINTDVTVHLDRLPTSDWIGFEVTGHESANGIAIGHCRLHDVEGAIGYATTAALANERRR